MLTSFKIERHNFIFIMKTVRVTSLNSKFQFESTKFSMILHDIWYFATKFFVIDYFFVSLDGNLAAHAVAAHVASHGDSFLWDYLESEFLFNILTEDVNVFIQL